MSETEKERKDNEGEILLQHSCHDEHPLSLTVAGERAGLCYGCRRNISATNKAYLCSRKCGYRVVLHEECAEMPQYITLSSHPRHSLVLKEYFFGVPRCAVCEKGIYRVGYYCSDSCKFQVHMGCAHDFRTWKGNVNIEHPSHPQHRLTLQEKSCSFRCDACGTKQTGSFYSCSNCLYWVHESCAALPPTGDFGHLHHHALSLAYLVPLDSIKFRFNYCRICYKILLPKYWVYRCQTCRYLVHINCAINPNPDMLSNTNADAAEGEDVISLPTKHTVEDMIASFVARVGGANGEYNLHNSDHQLSLVSSSSLHDQEEEKKDDDDYDDDDELPHYGNKSELVCDGCTTPILDTKQKKSSDECISCGNCKYFLHLACSRLPPELPSHPFHRQRDHILTLQSCSKLFYVCCKICGFNTNGLFYGCEKCSFRADVKCISPPDTIKHDSHPQHRLKLHAMDRFFSPDCDACGEPIDVDFCYKCDICEIMLHSSCCLLPAAVNSPTWDKKRPLPLIFDAAMNHPSSFYCEVCEQEMNPMLWMYHRRDTDVSIHPKCLPTLSGRHRNIKFGQRYLVEAVHNHPLAFQPLTKKVHCDVCGRRGVYGKRGFQCCSDKCEFVMCFENCGSRRRDGMLVVDD